MLQELITPTVNIGGTSRETLLQGYVFALEALRRAEAALMEIAPHARDYPANAPAWLEATKQHNRRLQSVTSTLGEISQIAGRVLPR